MTSQFKLGLEVLLEDKNLQEELKGKRIAYLGHPASIDRKARHGFDLIRQNTSLHLTAGFGPQHGMLGDKQDNMIESDDYRDPVHGIPVYSLYGKVRRPTDTMMQSFDVLLVDMQDVGCRIYTYHTTLLYMLEACAAHKKELWVLDRPNPAGRPVEGFFLDDSLYSFVGASRVPMRHGLTLGELAKFLCESFKLYVRMKLVPMQNYNPLEAPGFGWPMSTKSDGSWMDIPWVNPSPNIPTLCTARVFPGTVLLEGTLLNEGRGTTRPLQMFGAPGLPSRKIISELHKRAPQLLKSCLIRSCHYEPTFHKFKGQLCEGLQIHVDTRDYNHEKFQPFRLMLMIFKLIREERPDLMAWRQPPYEYENERLPIDLLAGDVRVRHWVDDSASTLEDLDKMLLAHENEWKEEMRRYTLYPV
jgi:uncharacterized protein YbbC (DUF1343 family)